MQETTSAATLPLLGFVAFSSDTGKTTLLKKIIPLLRGRGLRPALIKHVHCGFDLDTPGKDSYELRRAGADQVLVASAERWALMKEEPTPDNYPDLARMASRIEPESADLILVEGFKEAGHPKIEVHRQATGSPCLFPQDPSIVALASDAATKIATDLPRLDLNNPAQIVDFIIDFCGLNS
ncbi:MAG: molybdopterin-guanine dinucleotide biosynthesis protein B [Thermodesulfobacteriota bacterium]